MENFFGRTVFFVKDAERALAFYTETLGFTVDWNHQEEGRAFVLQVSLFGFQLILNQVEEWTQNRAGHGRTFVGLDDEQSAAFRGHLNEKGIQATTFQWGAPTLVLRDLDQNELFFGRRNVSGKAWKRIACKAAWKAAAGWQPAVLRSSP